MEETSESPEVETQVDVLAAESTEVAAQSIVSEAGADRDPQTTAQSNPIDSTTANAATVTTTIADNRSGSGSGFHGMIGSGSGGGGGSDNVIESATSGSHAQAKTQAQGNAPRKRPAPAPPRTQPGVGELDLVERVVRVYDTEDIRHVRCVWWLQGV